MCLAMPMQIVQLMESGLALCELNGVHRQVDVSLLDKPQEGDYVIVHAGFAIQQLDPREAEEQLTFLAGLVRGAAEDHRPPSPSEAGVWR